MTATGDAGAIEDVSATLAAVLEERIDTDVTVVVTSPDEVTNRTSPTVGLFLYDVAENPHESTLRREEIDTETVRLSPLVVDLHYLVTAYPSGSGDESQKSERAHRFLGEAMWAFRGDAVIRGSTLQGSLDGELRISRGEREDALVDIWNTFPDTSYLPSVAYTVGPVALDAGEPESVDRVRTLTIRGVDD
jgi:hypothetical protein